MQEKCCGVITQRVLCQRRDTEYSSRLVDVLDPLLGPAQVGVGHGRAIAEIQLDVGPQRVTLKRGTAELQSDERYALTLLFHPHHPHHLRKTKSNYQAAALKGESCNTERKTSSKSHRK